MRQVRIFPAVLQDVAEAAAWYDEQGHVGLGDRFITAFQRGLAQIQENGAANRKSYLEFRKLLIRPFPYSLYYRLHGSTWIVVLVVHAARQPQRIKRALRTRK